MALRDVLIRLRLDDSQFKAKIAGSVASVRQFEQDLEKSARKRQALDEIGGTFGKIGLAAGAAFGLASKGAADFESAMSSVRAAMGDMGPETDKNLGKLRDLAIEAGIRTKFSATEAAQGIEALGKAGLDTSKILGKNGALNTALDLAASEGMDVARSAEIMATAMSQFDLEGDKARLAADRLAGASYSAQGGIEDMSLALSYVGPVANRMGLDIDETTTAITLLAQKGILGEKAGTALRAMLTSLQSPAGAARKEINRLNLEFNKDGAFIGLPAAMDEIRSKLKGADANEVDTTLRKLFGVEAITAGGLLYDAGSKGLSKVNDEIERQASVAQIAATKMDNLSGDVEQLKGSLETALIGTGSGSQGALREATQDVTALVNAYNSLPQGAQTAVGGVTALTAALGLGVFAGTKAINAYATTRNNLNELGIQFDRSRVRALAFRGGVAVAGLALGDFVRKTDETNEVVGIFGGAISGAAVGSMFGPWGAAVGGAAGAIGGFADANGTAKQQVDDLTASLDIQTGAITENTKSKIANRLEKDGTLPAARRQGINPSDVIDAALGDPASQALINQFIESEKSRVISSLPKNTASARGAEARSVATGDFADLDQVSKSIGKVSEQTAEAKQRFDNLAEATRTLPTAKVNEIAAATRGIKRDVIMQFTTKGAPEAVDQAVEVARAQKLTKPQVTSVLKLLDYSPKQIQAVIEKLDELDGTEAEATLSVDNEEANRRIRETIALFNSMPTSLSGGGKDEPKPKGKKRAMGGPIFGPGTETSDSVPIMASRDEHMWTARETKAVGGHGAMYRLRAAALAGDLNFASGGAVGYTSRQRELEIAQLQAELADYKTRLKETKGKWPRRVLELEHVENVAALRRLKSGMDSDIDFGLSSIVEARNAPVSLFEQNTSSPWMSGGGYVARAQQKLTQIKTLAGKLVQLRKQGLSPALLTEISGLGSVAGIAAADELLRSPGSAKQLSSLYSQIQGVNGFIAAAAYEPPATQGGVKITLETKYDEKTLKAYIVATARDEAGKVLDRQSFESKVYN